MTLRITSHTTVLNLKFWNPLHSQVSTQYSKPIARPGKEEDMPAKKIVTSDLYIIYVSLFYRYDIVIKVIVLHFVYPFMGV